MPHKFLVVGLGNIGAGLAKAAIKNFPGEVSVWNRSIEKADTLFKSDEEAPEFTKYSSITDAIKENETIVISLFNYEACYNALSQSSNDFSTLSETVKLLKNKLVVQLTSGRPSEAKQWHELMTKAEANNSSGCVIGWPTFIGTEKFNILLSACPIETFNQLKPLLDCWGKATYAGDQAGQAEALDMGVLTYLQGIKFGFMQGLALCKEANVSTDQYLQFSLNYLNIYRGVLEDTVKKAEARNYTENINTTVEVLQNFNKNVMKHAEETGQSLEFFQAIDAPLSALLDDGKASYDQVASYEYMLNQKSDFFNKK